MLLLERIERRVTSERQSIQQAALTHGIDVDLPSVQDAWDEFDLELNEPARGVTREDRDRDDLLRALGIRR